MKIYVQILTIFLAFFSCASGLAADNVYPLHFATDSAFVMGACDSTANAGSANELALLSKGKLNGARFDVPWKYVETKKGVYTIPTAWDNAVNQLVAKNIQPLLILDYGNPLYNVQNSTRA